MNDKEYMLAVDSDGHWFVVASIDYGKLREELEKIESGEDGSLDGIDATRINGSPTKVRFMKWRTA